MHNGTEKRNTGIRTIIAFFRQGADGGVLFLGRLRRGLSAVWMRKPRQYLDQTADQVCFWIITTLNDADDGPDASGFGEGVQEMFDEIGDIKAGRQMVCVRCFRAGSRRPGRAPRKRLVHVPP